MHVSLKWGLPTSGAWPLIHGPITISLFRSEWTRGSGSKIYGSPVFCRKKAHIPLVNSMIYHFWFLGCWLWRDSESLGTVGKNSTSDVCWGRRMDRGGFDVHDGNFPCSSSNLPFLLHLPFLLYAFYIPLVLWFEKFKWTEIVSSNEIAYGSPVCKTNKNWVTLEMKWEGELQGLLWPWGSALGSPGTLLQPLFLRHIPPFLPLCFSSPRSLNLERCPANPPSCQGSSLP